MRLPKPLNQGEATFFYYWKLLAKDCPLPLCTENGGQYQFCAERAWQIDFCWLYPRKVAVEINGQPHAIAKQRQKDYEKWNALAEAGFVLLHFSPQQITDDPARCIEQVKRLLRA